MSIRLLPYNMASEAARLLQRDLGSRMIINDRARTRYEPNQADMIINWGCTNPWINPQDVGTFFNYGSAVHNVSNKLRFFTAHDRKFNHPDWTTQPGIVLGWLQQGYTVFARHELAGMGGSGIQIIEPGDEAFARGGVPAAPLYTKYIPKAAEYRVHVVISKVIDLQQKVRREGAQGNFKIRSHDNGFVFARNVGGQPVRDIVPRCVTQQAVNAIIASDLDFGGVDVIYNRRQNKAYVLEINSAPGIEGTTVKSYAHEFASYYRNVNV